VVGLINVYSAARGRPPEKPIQWYGKYYIKDFLLVHNKNKTKIISITSIHRCRSVFI